MVQMNETFATANADHEQSVSEVQNALATVRSSFS